MKQKFFSEIKINNAAFYLLGLCFVLLCLISSYRIWNKSQQVTVENVIVQESSDQIAILTAEAELLNSNALHPELIINDGDTLGSLLSEAGINNNESNLLINAFAKKYNPRKLNIGTLITLNFEDNASGHVLQNMVVTINNTKKIEVSRNLNNEFTAAEILVPLVHKVEKKIGVIKNSFIAAASELSIPANAIMGMIRAFSYDVDFQRDIKQGDKLEVVVDKFYTEDGKLARSGDVLYSSLTLGDRKISIYQFVHSDGQIGYYNDKGESIKKEFLRTPLNAAKISSKFGMRQHPVHGYSKMHKGIDFAAPIGTPILAAGGGVVEVMNNHFGGYGRYIRIKHNSSYSTVYAHASRFAKGVKPGSKVTQGQVIAYVGTTGVSTGPHLHYEVLERGKHINPLKFKFASNSEKLSGKEFEEFKRTKQKIAKYLAG